jgi:hypothetical protein
MQHIASRPAPADRVRRFDAGKAVRAAWGLTPGEARRRMQALGLAGAARPMA